MDKKTLLETSFFSVEVLTDPERGIVPENPYYRIVESDGIIVLAITSDQRIVLVRQFRPALGEYTLELPAGGIAKGESVIDAARRELHEETGYRAEEFIALNKGMPLLANRSTMKGFAFLAKNITKDEQSKPEGSIEVVEVTIEELRTMASDGTFTQNAGLGAILLWLWSNHGITLDGIR